MLWVAVVVLTIWFGGKFVALQASIRVLLLGLVAAFILLSFLILPAENAIIIALGGDIFLWITIFLSVTLISFYRYFLALVRKRNVKSMPKQVSDAPFSDTELDRYARHIVLREIGGSGQVALKNSKVLVIGAGGLGSPVLMYLAAAGVGTLGVVDDDVVDNSNLQRQVIHNDADIGRLKVNSAKAAIEAQNPFIMVNTYPERLSEANAVEIMTGYDLIVEGSDNFATRYVVNKYAATLKIPVVSGALTQWEGQLSIFDPSTGSPCYQCIFPTAPKPELAPSCSQAGVVGPLTGVMGSMMAVEVIKEITGAGQRLRGKMLLYDALYSDIRIIKIAKRADCECCGEINL